MGGTAVMSFLGKKQETQPQVDTMHDSLTGLKNRNYFHHNYGELGPVKSKEHLVMVVFDIDHFKAANELIDGDMAIQDIVRIMCEVINGQGDLMRWGGDEFVAILTTDLEESAAKMKEFVRRVKAETKVTVSVGIVRIRHEDTFKTNYYRAVQRCYLVKEMGGNDVGYTSK
jgi:diguanylate cyclase (GGDEF)-like protein